MEDIQGKTVLIVDDEPDVQLYLQTILEDAGFDVMVAGNGKQALERMSDKKPDVISLDLVMPKMSGLKFFRYIQKNKDRREIPVVIVTAHARDEFGQPDLEKLHKEPRHCELYYLEKPVKPPHYVHVVKQALGLTTEEYVDEETDDLRERLKQKLRAADQDKLKAALKLLG